MPQAPGSFYALLQRRLDVVYVDGVDGVGDYGDLPPGPVHAGASGLLQRRPTAVEPRSGLLRLQVSFLLLALLYYFHQPTH